MFLLEPLVEASPCPLWCSWHRLQRHLLHQVYLQHLLLPAQQHVRLHRLLFDQVSSTICPPVFDRAVHRPLFFELYLSTVNFGGWMLLLLGKVLHLSWMLLLVKVLLVKVLLGNVLLRNVLLGKMLLVKVLHPRWQFWGFTT